MNTYTKIVRASKPIPLPTAPPITQQPRGFDLLGLPGLRRFVRWKYARLLVQLPLLILAIMVIIDGFTGRQLAPRNLSTTSIWLHYRGFVVIALALFGNAFCAACPLMLTRGLTRRLERFLPHKWHWPSQLKNKYFIMVFLFIYFFSYEYFNLWASPWITAWLVVGYFAGALIVDTLWPAGTFCRYICPLGNFNFALASASPTQITAVNHDVCRSCADKPCLHGRYSAASKPDALAMQSGGGKEVAFIPLSEIKSSNGQGYFPGCETGLFVPSMQSNMDCTQCFNCVRACPYDNVALTMRSPAWEWTQNPWAKRGRLAVMLMAVMLTYYGLMNAIAMIGPFFDTAEAIATTLRTDSEFLVLGLIFLLIVGVGLTITTGMAMLADLAGGVTTNPKQALLRWGYVTVALGFGFWFAHYIFHFLTGALSIIPVFQHFFSYRGVDITPNWRLSQVIPSRYLFPITASITMLYSLVAVYVAIRISLRDFGRRGVLAMWPMMLYVLAFAALALIILAQPMEMRGTIFGPSY